MSDSVRAQDLHFSWGQKKILDGVSFSVAPGETFGVIGPSGVGKTVLLKLLSGLLKPTSGSLVVPRPLGMAFQRGGLFDFVTVEGNLRFAMQELGLKGEEVSEHWLKAVGLWHARSAQVHELSGGMQKRLGIARALVGKPSFLLLDDPTAGLDPITSLEIVELLKSLTKEQHLVTVLATSDLSVAARLSTEVAFLWHGAFAEKGKWAALVASQEPVTSQFLHGRLNGPMGERL